MNKRTYKDNKIVRNNIKEKEDATKYGEFVSSYFAWLTLDKQKQNAEELAHMTEEEGKQQK